MKKKIFFVDDDQDVLTITELLLKGLGHEVLFANSGEKAIEIIKSTVSAKIDLMFLDLMMHGIDGFDVLEFMKNSNIQIPTIVQTGIIDNNDLKKAKNLGAIDYILKPYTREDIKRLINKYII